MINQLKNWVVIIPTLNRENDIMEMINWIENWKTIPNRVIIIDQSEYPLKFSKKSIVLDNFTLEFFIWFAPKLGSGRARNVMLSDINEEFILYLDDDLGPNLTFDLLRSYNSLFQNNINFSYIDGGYFPTEINRNFKRDAIINFKAELGFINLLTTTYNNPNEELRPTIGLTAGNFAIKTKVIKIVGGFDERYGLGEDRELGLRLWKMGYIGINARQLRLIHKKSLLGGMRNDKRKIINSFSPLIFVFALEHFPRWIAIKERNDLIKKYFLSMNIKYPKKSLYAFFKIIALFRAWNNAINFKNTSNPDYWFNNKTYSGLYSSILNKD